MSTTVWDEVDEAREVKPSFAVVDIPTFSEDGLVWNESSSLILQYNYSATQRFVLLNRPTKPSGVNFVPCIKYRIDTTVYRYKLWDHDDCVLDAPLYNGEVIRKNFCIEIWSVSSSASVDNVSTIRMLSNRHVDRTSIRDYATVYALCSGSSVDLSVLIPNLVGMDVVGQWTGAGMVDNMTVQDLSGQNHNLASADVIFTEYDTVLTDVIRFRPVLSLATTGNVYAMMITQLSCVLNLTSDMTAAHNIIDGIIARAGDTLTITWPGFVGASLVHVLVPGQFGVPLVIHAGACSDLGGTITYMFEIRNLMTNAVLATASGTIAGLSGSPTAIITNPTAANSFNIIEILLGRGALVDYDLLAAVTVANTYFQQKYVQGLGSLSFDNPAAWLNNAETDTEDAAFVVASNLQTILQLDYFYMMAEDGRYYRVKLTDVDGFKDLQTSQTPL